MYQIQNVIDFKSWLFGNKNEINGHISWLFKFRTINITSYYFMDYHMFVYMS